mmetsp:Transcript_39512/g.79212  ORF Transcript_39512/g.79212 Transcript_39512/m.79212 type:complete len:267 (-) Transcript_39512:61-861(-)
MAALDLTGFTLSFLLLVLPSEQFQPLAAVSLSVSSLQGVQGGQLEHRRAPNDDIKLMASQRVGCRNGFQLKTLRCTMNSESVSSDGVTTRLISATEAASIVSTWKTVLETMSEEPDVSGQLSTEVMVERIVRQEVAKERLGVLTDMARWFLSLPQPYPERPEWFGLATWSGEEATGIGCLERRVFEGNLPDEFFTTLIAVKPDEIGAETQGGWTAREDAWSGALVKAVADAAECNQCRTDFAGIEDLHEGRVWLWTKPFDPNGFRV